MIRLDRSILVFLLALGLVAGAALAGEGRIPIYQDPTVITQPGKYIVTRNIGSGGGTPVIDVQAPDVDIDLNGMVVSGSPGTDVIIAINQRNLAIRNGIVLAGLNGILVMDSDKVILEDLRILDTSGSGIHVLNTSDFAVRRVNVFGAVNEGIFVDGVARLVQGVIEHSQIERCGDRIVVRQGTSVAIRDNRITELTSAAARGGIVYDVSRDGLILENTIYLTASGPGIYLGDSVATKIHNNVINDLDVQCIHLAGLSNDNLVLDNVMSECRRDGILVDGARNFVQGNLINLNGPGGAGFGLHFTTGAFDNVYGRNLARGNAGGPCIGPSTPDWCDEGPGNTSFGDNFMPNLF